MAKDVEEGLFISPELAKRLVENIRKYRGRNPVDDDEWDEMDAALGQIDADLEQILQDNDAL